MTHRRFCTFNTRENTPGILLSIPHQKISLQSYASNTNANRNVRLQSLVSRLIKNNIVDRTLVTLPWERREKVCYLRVFAHAAEIDIWYWKIKTASYQIPHAMIDLRPRQKMIPRPTLVVSGQANGCVCRLNKYEVDLFSRGPEVARVVLRSSPKPDKGCIFAIVGAKIYIFVYCFLYTSGQKHS